MIKEVYVSFEVAQLLKEKGFDEECLYRYIAEPDYITPSLVCSPIGKGSRYLYSAPTQQMAMRWLREIHKIFICIEFDVPTFTADIYKMDEIDEYGCAKHIPPTIANCKTYEEAVEAALKYILLNITWFKL